MAAKRIKGKFLPAGAGRNAPRKIRVLEGQKRKWAKILCTQETILAKLEKKRPRDYSDFDYLLAKNRQKALIRGARAQIEEIDRELKT